MIWKAGESEKYSKKKKRFREKKEKEEEYIYHSYKTKKNIAVSFAVIEL